MYSIVFMGRNVISHTIVHPDLEREHYVLQAVDVTEARHMAWTFMTAANPNGFVDQWVTMPSTASAHVITAGSDTILVLPTADLDDADVLLDIAFD